MELGIELVILGSIEVVILRFGSMCRRHVSKGMRLKLGEGEDGRSTEEEEKG
jgi:hypothetical protein